MIYKNVTSWSNIEKARNLPRGARTKLIISSKKVGKNTMCYAYEMIIERIGMGGRPNKSDFFLEIDYEIQV